MSAKGRRAVTGRPYHGAAVMPRREVIRTLCEKRSGSGKELKSSSLSAMAAGEGRERYLNADGVWKCFGSEESAGRSSIRLMILRMSFLNGW